MAMKTSSLVLAVLTAVLCSCGKTTLQVRSNPSGAQFFLSPAGVRGTTDTEVKLSKKLFDAGETRSESLTVQKAGFRTATVPVTLREGKDNRTTPGVISLQALSSSITITSSPVGASMSFDVPAGTQLPQGWTQSFRTPVTFRATNSEAGRLVGGSAPLSFATLDFEGMAPVGFRVGSPVPFQVGQNTTITVPFEPVVTTLTIITEPEGAYVEDMTEGGFGYLGETPLTHNFTWQDISRWVERTQVGGGITPAGGPTRLSAAFEAILLQLRVSKMGYEDVVLKNTRIPIGESRSFKRTMTEVTKEIRFDSDPKGVHVYVMRSIDREEFNAETNSYNTISLPHEVHLGQTPFNLNLDQNALSDTAQPLSHGDTLIWKKASPVVGNPMVQKSSVYTEGQKLFHMVM